MLVHITKGLPHVAEFFSSGTTWRLDRNALTESHSVSCEALPISLSLQHNFITALTELQGTHLSRIRKVPLRGTSGSLCAIEGSGHQTFLFTALDTHGPDVALKLFGHLRSSQCKRKKKVLWLYKGDFPKFFLMNKREPLMLQLSACYRSVVVNFTLNNKAVVEKQNLFRSKFHQTQRN